MSLREAPQKVFRRSCTGGIQMGVLPSDVGLLVDDTERLNENAASNRGAEYEVWMLMKVEGL